MSDALFAFWQGGVDHQPVKQRLTVEMAREDFRLWQAAGVAIEHAYRQYQSPLDRLSELGSSLPCRPIYSLDRDENYLKQQQAFAADHPFFSVLRLEHARTHLGILERPDEVYRAVVNFLGD